MKIENTPENKARFFTLYWGQKIAMYKTDQSVKFRIGNPIFDINHADKIELTPLSQITDGDAEWVTRNESVSPDWGRRDTARKIFLEYGFSGKLKTSTIDYLRSKGCAIDWMGLSVETLEEYGWVKIKEN